MWNPDRVQVAGPLARHAEGFCGHLAQRGHGRNWAAVQMRQMAHLSQWLEDRGLDSDGLTPEALEAFVAQRRADGQADLISVRGLEALVDYLRPPGILPRARPVLAPASERLLARYARYLREERGLAEKTVKIYLRCVRPFAAGRVPHEDGRAWELSAADVTAFVLSCCRDGRSTPVPQQMTALRSLLRFLHVEGLVDQPLAGAVPRVAYHRLSGLPKALEPGQAEALLASCDSTTVAGRRDRALLTVLFRLALRAEEAGRLLLDDIDWRRGEVTVRGKGSRCERIPLPVDVGEALMAYLTSQRPTDGATGRAVFLRVTPPYGPMTSGGVSHVVERAARRAGLRDVRAHRLRHTAATGMLRAGASLAEVGQVLRHRQAQTTAIYAKVDLDALRTVARPWPAGGAR